MTFPKVIPVIPTLTIGAKYSVIFQLVNSLQYIYSSMRAQYCSTVGSILGVHAVVNIKGQYVERNFFTQVFFIDLLYMGPRFRGYTISDFGFRFAKLFNLLSIPRCSSIDFFKIINLHFFGKMKTICRMIPIIDNKGRF
jgi:hypothetical protein